MRLIRETYETVTDESAEYGDFADAGWIDEEGKSMEPDEWDMEEGLTAVDLTVDYLFDRGATMASSYPFCSGSWYTTPDPDIDYSTGEQTSYSFHLEGFTEEEQKEIYDRLRKNQR